MDTIELLMFRTVTTPATTIGDSLLMEALPSNLRIPPLGSVVPLHAVRITATKTVPTNLGIHTSLERLPCAIQSCERERCAPSSRWAGLLAFTQATNRPLDETLQS